MRIRTYITSALMPPVGACRYGCGSSCAAPVTVFWLFGIVSVVFGLLGGPTAEPGVSWHTVGLGLAMWAIAAVWTMLTIQGAETEGCQGTPPPGDHRGGHMERRVDGFDDVDKAH